MALGLVAGALALHVGHANLFALVTTLAFGVFGTVSYNYVDPGSGTVPATAAQAGRRNSQTLELTLQDADTIATFTHNWGLTTYQTNLDRPWVICWAKSGIGTGGFTPMFTHQTNITVVTKSAVTGSGAVWAITLMRPHTLIR